MHVDGVLGMTVAEMVFVVSGWLKCHMGTIDGTYNLRHGIPVPLVVFPPVTVAWQYTGAPAL